MKRAQSGLNINRAKPRSPKSLKKLIDEGFERFLDKRPWLRRVGIDPVFTEGYVPPKKKPTAQALAEQYLAYEYPARGLLKQLCEQNRLKYGTVAAAIKALRIKRGMPLQRRVTRRKSA